MANYLIRIVGASTALLALAMPLQANVIWPATGFSEQNTFEDRTFVTPTQTPPRNVNISSLPLDISSRAAIVADARTGEVLYGKNSNEIVPIASITKLMTAMIVLDADQDMNEMLRITDADVDRLRNSRSRLNVGTELSRADMLLIMLMSSENRAASALARNYPGGFNAAMAAMNQKARTLGMTNSHFMDSSGLHGENRSTPADLIKMVQAAYNYAQIRTYSTMPEYHVVVGNNNTVLTYRNTNQLVSSESWDIGISKTGFINEAGRCLVMFAKVTDTPVIIVLMDSPNNSVRTTDANRVRNWLEVSLNGRNYRSGS